MLRSSLQSIRDIDWQGLISGHAPFHPSPVAWEDQMFYFLLVDRFSDGNETGYRDNQGGIVTIAGGNPAFASVGYGEDGDVFAEGVDSARAERWRQAGTTWCGGNLRGLATKLGYLKRLGVTALWISPILKQCAYAPDCYHGYGIQNFLEIDPHFGTQDDLRALVTTAHELGIYVILDVVINHAGDVFAYQAEEEDPTWRPEPYPVAAFRDRNGEPTLPFAVLDPGQHPDAFPDGAVWPQELQNPDCFTRKGRIQNWDALPEYQEGDFFGFKDIHLGAEAEGGEEFVPSTALQTLVAVYQYWMASADLDGFRLDTVKHMPAGAVSYFAREMHSFAAEKLGKQNFFIVGEIVGTQEDACQTLIDTGLNAALGIGEVPRNIRRVVCGWDNPADYFDLFVNSRREGEEDPEPVWWRDRVVTFFDDHDQVGKDTWGRLASDFPEDREQAERTVLRAVAFQSLTLGIPCLYYGTEQGLDGRAPEKKEQVSQNDAAGNTTVSAAPDPDDRYIRECLFGGEFGAFHSRERHFFHEEGWLYREIAKVLQLRRGHAALRRGRQYLRELSLDGEEFWLPQPGEEPYLGLIAWSRLLDVDEFVCAINTDPVAPQSALVTVDEVRNGSSEDAMPSRRLVCVYSTDLKQIGASVGVPERVQGRSAVWLTVPPGGAVVYR